MAVAPWHLPTADGRRRTADRPTSWPWLPAAFVPSVARAGQRRLARQTFGVPVAPVDAGQRRLGRCYRGRLTSVALGSLQGRSAFGLRLELHVVEVAVL